MGHSIPPPLAREKGWRHWSLPAPSEASQDAGIKGSDSSGPRHAAKGQGLVTPRFPVERQSPSPGVMCHQLSPSPSRSGGIAASSPSAGKPAQCHRTAKLGTPQDLPVPPRGRWHRGAGVWPPPYFAPPSCPELGPVPGAVPPPPTSNMLPTSPGGQEVYRDRGGPAVVTVAVPAGCSLHSSAGGSCAATPARPPQCH